MITQQEALYSFANLCDKLGEMIDSANARMADLEHKLYILESQQSTLYSQQQVAEITGWSVSAINNWLKTGFITAVPVRGKKNPAIPASEIGVILSKKGRGHKAARDL